MMKKRTLFVVVLCLALVSNAEIFVFNFNVTDGAFDFETATGQVATNGITMDFAAIVSGDPAAVLNAGSGNFGVNASGSDDASLLNAGQTITIAFSSTVYSRIELQFIDLGLFTTAGADAGTYQITGESAVALSGDTALAKDVLNKTIAFTSTSGAWSLNGITVEAIPEPATMSMLGLGVLLLIVRRMFRT